MATVRGVNNTLYNSTPRSLPDSSKWGGRLRVAYDTYEAAALASGSTIATAVVPKGARIYDIHVLADDLGTSTTTISVGDSGDASRFIAAFATGAATFKSLLKDGKIDAVGHQYDAETEILLTTAVGSITGTVTVVVYYVVD